MQTLLKRRWNRKTERRTDERRRDGGQRDGDWSLTESRQRLEAKKRLERERHTELIFPQNKIKNPNFLLFIGSQYPNR